MTGWVYLARPRDGRMRDILDRLTKKTKPKKTHALMKYTTISSDLMNMVPAVDLVFFIHCPMKRNQGQAIERGWAY